MPPQASTGQPALYKLHFGKKYFIWKGKTFKESVDQNMVDIYRTWSKIDTAKKDHFFYPVAAYIKRTRTYQARIELIMQTDDVDALIQREADILQECQGDDNCLNTSFEPYRPKWIDQYSPNEAQIKPVEPPALEAEVLESLMDISEPVEPKIKPQDEEADMSDLLEALKHLDGTEEA